MSEAFFDPADLSRLKEMSEAAPEEFKAWANLDGIVGRKDGDIPHKYRELIAVAVAVTTQCPYCIMVHSKNARKAGATKEELVEATLIAAALRAGAGATHGLAAMKMFEEE